MKYNLDFITYENLKKHIRLTIEEYKKSLEGINLKKFNSNLIDPIKFLFDMNLYNKDIKEIISLEIIRQKDKSNNNIIGYFHQNIFKYINNKNWLVPKNGWDLVNEKEKIYIEMKNKHNTMNSSSSKNTYLKMNSKLLADHNNICMLVEVIAKKSQDIPWKVKITNNDNASHKNIRRVSIDRFYNIVFQDKYAFYNLTSTLKWLIPEVIKEMNFHNDKNIKDTVIQELDKDNNDLLNSLFNLAFKTYFGWDEN